MAIDKTDLMLLMASMSGGVSSHRLMQAIMAKKMAKGSGKENIAALIGMLSGDRASLMSSLSALGAAPQNIESNTFLDTISGQVEDVDTGVDSTTGILGEASTEGETVIGTLREIKEVLEERSTTVDVDELGKEIRDTHVPRLSGEVQDARNKLATLSVVTNQNTVAVRADITTLSGSLDRQVGEIKTDIGTLSNSLDGKTNSVRSDIATVDGKVVTVDGKVVTVDGKVVAVDGKVVALHQAVEETVFIHSDIKYHPGAKRICSL